MSKCHYYNIVIDFYIYHFLSFHRNHQLNSFKPSFPVAQRICFQIHICQMDVQYQTYIIIHKSCELSKRIKKQNNQKILRRFESPFLRLPTGSTGHGRNCFGLATKTGTTFTGHPPDTAWKHPAAVPPPNGRLWPIQSEPGQKRWGRGSVLLYLLGFISKRDDMVSFHGLS